MSGMGFLAVGVGAALGAWLRWMFAVLWNAIHPALPYGTLAANLLGGYLVGVAVGYFDTHRKKHRRKRIASTSEASLKVIRDKARKLLAEFIIDPDGFEQTYYASLSVERFIYDDYLPAVQETHLSIRTIKSRIKPIVAAFGHKPLNRVTRDDIERFQAEQAKTKSVAYSGRS